MFDPSGCDFIARRRAHTTQINTKRRHNDGEQYHPHSWSRGDAETIKCFYLLIADSHDARANTTRYPQYITIEIICLFSKSGLVLRLFVCFNYARSHAVARVAGYISNKRFENKKLMACVHLIIMIITKIVSLRECANKQSNLSEDKTRAAFISYFHCVRFSICRVWHIRRCLNRIEFRVGRRLHHFRDTSAWLFSTHLPPLSS